MNKLSRGRFITAAATTGGLLTVPILARAGAPPPYEIVVTANNQPLPLPADSKEGGLHNQEPGGGRDPSQIYNFSGMVAKGQAKGSATGNGAPLTYDAQVGFMQGTYQSTSGVMQTGTFVFI